MSEKRKEIVHLILWHNISSLNCLTKNISLLACQGYKKFLGKAHASEEESKKRSTKFSTLNSVPNYSPGWAESASVYNRLLVIWANVSPRGPINFNRGSTENQRMRPNIIPEKIR